MTEEPCAQVGAAGRSARGTLGRFAPIALLLTAIGSEGAAQTTVPAGRTTTRPAQATRPTATTRSAVPDKSATSAEAAVDEYVVIRDIRGIMRRRVVKAFDFDERKLGNMEEVPMYWRRHLGKGFPHYLVGRFDPDVGHEAPPSFHLRLKGGSLAYVYRAQDIPVHIRSDYLVTAWVLPDKLRHSRASVSAFYADRNGRKLPGTERFSRLIGVEDGPEPWQQVAITLPGGHAKARHIGVAVWVVQPGRNSGPGRNRHEIYREDINAGAWFDDLRIVRLPRASLTAAQAGNVFSADQECVLLAEVSDPDGKDLTARLDVLSIEGQTLLSEQVRVATRANPGPELIRCGRLPPGLYVARLTVSSGELQLSEDEVRFAQLGPRLNPAGWRNEGFGLILNQDDYLCADAAARLIDFLHVPHVKLPIGVPSIGKRQGPDTTGPALKLLKKLWQGRVHAVAILAPARSSSRSDRPGRPDHSWRSFLLALAEEPVVWRPYVTPPLVRYASFVQSWQVGADEDDSLAWDARLGDSLSAFRAELTRLVPSSEMVVAWPILHQPPPKPLEAHYVSLYVPNTVRPEAIVSHIGDFKKARPEGLWVVVEPLEPGRHDRAAQLADLTRRLIAAHVAATDVVYLPRPWDVVRQAARPHLQPREAYLAFRTVAELLSRSRPVGEVYLSEGVRSVTFDRNGAGIVALWADQAPPEGRPYGIYLGQAPEQVDLWGRTRPLQRIENRHRIHLGPTPVFVRRTNVWHLKLRASFSLEPSQIESSHRLHEPEVRFVNTRNTPIGGVVRLGVPRGWEVRPVRIPFSLSPGQELRTKVVLRFPSSETTGQKILVGWFLIDSDRTYEFEALAPFALGLDDFEVRSFARIERNTVIVHQAITNRSGTRADIEGYVLAPGRARRTRMFRRLEPGQTILRKYVLDDADRLLGGSIRVGIKEIHGPRFLNQSLRIQ